MVTRYSARKGFTLVEILIVVIILGILAAIVIPQFTNASQDARKSSLKSTVQSIRSQVELYKLEQGDQLPDIVTNWTPLTTRTEYPTGSGKFFGPYMHSAPKNGMTNTDTVVDGDASDPAYAPAGTHGFIYDYQGGNGTGRLFGVEVASDGTTRTVQRD